MSALLDPVAIGIFHDRHEAGRRLAERLEHLRSEHPVVLGLPRGGVPVAYEVARSLEAPLDALLVRKLGAPLRPEFGVGAIAEGDVRIIDHRALAALGIEPEELKEVVARETAELERRQRLYRGTRPPVRLEKRTVILVDDGVATGGTALAAARAARIRGAARVVLAVPVGPPEAERRFAGEVDEFICLQEPEGFFAVGRLLPGLQPDQRRGGP